MTFHVAWYVHIETDVSASHVHPSSSGNTCSLDTLVSSPKCGVFAAPAVGGWILKRPFLPFSINVVFATRVLAMSSVPVKLCLGWKSFQLVADQLMMLSLEISLVHRGKYVNALSPPLLSPPLIALVFALYNRNTRLLAFLATVIILNFFNNAFWTFRGIRRTTSVGPCIAENPPFWAVYLA